MTPPLCSVLLPVRNAAATLGECLASIAAQSEQRYELVAINDHSDDASLSLLQQAARTDPRIRVIDRPARGLVPVLNAGLSACRTELIARMDADDVMYPTRLAEQLAGLRAAPAIDVLATRVELIETPATAAGQREYVRWQNACTSPGEIADRRFVESPVTHPSVMFRRSAIEAAGGYRDGPFAEDYDLWLRLLAANRQIAKLPRVLLGWRDGEQRLTRTDPRCSRAAFDALRARYLAADARVTAADGVVVWGAGRRTRQRVRYLQEAGVRVRAWIDIDPRKIGNVIDGVRVLAPGALPELEAPFVLSYVANHGAREDIARALTGMGLHEGQDWLSVG